ncbi:uncharacterized protein LOC123557560 isoform X1 [Mercenaria mercenaria]|uniref:uncharacterized protein LOC123557560 isoform X1 n=1 Tax=Mercenaria mercenaria TaxID=6596 RepID=UPI00234F8EBF|nr:uncharacterized protein LOC123557560 isoform X1 [Mercenaria mercenaria]
MVIAATSKHVCHLLVVVLLVLTTCSAHKYGYNSQKGRVSSRRGNLAGISQCYSFGQLACHASGFIVRCYTSSQRCDGTLNCPMGEDEFNCVSDITVTRTSFSTTTSTTTTTYTTTSSTTISATTTTTVTSSTTTISTSSRKLTAVIPWKATSSSTTVIVSSTINYSTLVQVPIGLDYAANDIVCRGLADVAAGPVAGNNVFLLTISTPTINIPATAHVMCMPSTTSFV